MILTDRKFDRDAVLGAMLFVTIDKVQVWHKQECRRADSDRRRGRVETTNSSGPNICNSRRETELRLQ
jgi:hypothetical protein